MQNIRESFGRNISDRLFDVAMISLGAVAVAGAIVAVTSSFLGEKACRYVKRLVDEEFRLNDDLTIAKGEFYQKLDRNGPEAERYRVLLKNAVSFYQREGDFNAANEFVAEFNYVYPKS